MTDVKFSVDYSKRLSKCKKCKSEIPKGDVRLAKLVPNFFGGDDSDKDMKQFYHIKCLFETFKRARATTKKIESADDIEDFQSIKDADKKLVFKFIDARGKDAKATPSASKKAALAKTDSESSSDEDDDKKKRSKEKKVSNNDSDDGLEIKDVNCDDNKFETFQTIVERIADESSHLKKSAILKKFFQDGIKASKQIKA